jgi:hypothetical protein
MSAKYKCEILSIPGGVKNEKFLDVCHEHCKIRKNPRSFCHFPLRFGRTIEYIIINIQNFSSDFF